MNVLSFFLLGNMCLWAKAPAIKGCHCKRTRVFSKLCLMQSTVFSEKGGSQMPWRQAKGLHGMLFHRSYISLTSRLKESRFLPTSAAGLCTSDCGTTRQVCRAGGSPHLSWAQDRWEGKQFLRDLLQPGSSSVHSSASCKALAGSKHFKKSLLLLFPKKVHNFFCVDFDP